MTQLIFESNPWLLPLLMLIVLSLSIEMPYRLARSLHPRLAGSTEGLNTTLAGLLTLSSFVLGLSFAEASARFDARRALVVNEANAIGTTWLRADQLAARQRTRFRQILTSYAAIRLEAYESPAARELHGRAIEQSDKDQAEAWAIASSALRARPTNLGLSLLMQSLNETIDVSAEILQALTSHVPTAVIVLTLVLVTLATLTLGFRFALEGSRPAIVSVLYVVATVVVVSMMVDYDRPGNGFVTVNVNPLKLQVQSMQRLP